MFAQVVPLVLTCHWTVGVGEPPAAALKLAVDPDVTVRLVGCAVTAGTACTVNVACSVVTFPAAFVKMARYCLPVSASAVVREYVAEVAPVMFVQVVPLVLTCHRTVGVGEPLAAAMKLVVDPEDTVRLVGCVVTAGTVCTVNVAAFVVAFPAAFVKMARYFLPVSANVVAKEYVGEVAPVIFVQVVPSVLTCHRTVGVGEPLATAMKLVVTPEVTVRLVGWVVTAGTV